MRLAIATENGRVSAHFGHCPHFTLVDISDGAVTGQTIVESPDHAPGRIPRFLKEHGADVVIAGGIGHKAIQLFDSLGIQQIIGVTGLVDEVVTGCLDGTIAGGESLCSHGRDAVSGRHPSHGGSSPDCQPGEGPHR